MFRFNRALNISLKTIRFNSTNSQLKSEYEFITAEIRGKAGLITLNRPKALNALCDGLLQDLIHAARAFDNNNEIGAIVITGSTKAFAAGADIKEMSGRNYADCYIKNMFQDWTGIASITKPVSQFRLLLKIIFLFVVSLDHCSSFGICIRWWM